MPPAPIVPTISYGPSRVPGFIGIRCRSSWRDGLLVLLRRRFLLSVFDRLRRPPPGQLEGDAVPDRVDFSLNLVMACDEVFEDRLVPLQTGVGDQLHPVAPRGFVGRFGDTVPDRHVWLTRHEVGALRVRARALDRLVDQ